jgi:hypothetical protein
MDGPQDLADNIKNAVSQHFPRDSVLRVRSENAVDSAGDDALDIFITLADGAERQISGKQVMEANAAIRSVMTGIGDERTPIIHYATETEEAAPEELGPVPS